MKILEQIDSALLRKGLSPAAASRAAVKNSSFIKNIKAGSSPSVENLGKLAEVLDLELYFGPPRSNETTAGFSDLQLPVIGWARCGTRGEGSTQVAEERTAPAPIGYDRTAAFYAKAMGHSMRPEGIASGDYALIDPNRAPSVGDRVWIKDIKHLASLKRFTGSDERSCHFRGWLDPSDGPQRSFNLEMPRTAVVDLFPVVAVFDGPPGSASPPTLRTDPRADEFLLADGPMRKIAEALDLDPGASPDDILMTIRDLKGAAEKLIEVSRMINKIDPLKGRLKNR